MSNALECLKNTQDSIERFKGYITDTLKDFDVQDIIVTSGSYCSIIINYKCNNWDKAITIKYYLGSDEFYYERQIITESVLLDGALIDFMQSIRKALGIIS